MPIRAALGDGAAKLAAQNPSNPGASLQVCDQSKKVSIYVHLHRHPPELLLTLSLHDSD